MEVKRGEIWWADLSPTIGTEQSGLRPVLVVQTDRANPHSPHTIIVPFTTKIQRKILPSHVFIPATESSLPEDSVILCEQIRVIDKQRLIRKTGNLTEKYLSEVDFALKEILSLSTH